MFAEELIEHESPQGISTSQVKILTQDSLLAMTWSEAEFPSDSAYLTAQILLLPKIWASILYSQLARPSFYCTHGA